MAPHVAPGLRAASLRGRSTRSDAAYGKTEKEGDVGSDEVHMACIFDPCTAQLQEKSPYKSITYAVIHNNLERFG